MKKYILTILCILGLFATNVYAKKEEKVVPAPAPEVTEVEEPKVTVYIFKKDGCPFCEAAKEYLESLLSDKKMKNYFQIKEYVVWNADWTENEEESRLMNAVASTLGVEVGGAPFIVIGDKFNKNGYTEEWNDEFKQAIKDEYANENYLDLVAYTAVNMPVEVKTNDTWIIIGMLAVVAGGIAALVIFSRKK